MSGPNSPDVGHVRTVPFAPCATTASSARRASRGGCTAHPAMLIGGLRALMLQSLHPHALAGVVQHSDFRERPMHRLRADVARTSRRRRSARPTQARAAGERVRRVHRHINGIDPVTGHALQRRGPRDAAVGPLRRGPLVPRRRPRLRRAAERRRAGRLPGRERARRRARRDPAGDGAGRRARRCAPTSTRCSRALCLSWEAKQTIDFVVSPPLTRELLPYQAPAAHRGDARRSASSRGTCAAWPASTAPARSMPPPTPRSAPPSARSPSG